MQLALATKPRAVSQTARTLDILLVEEASFTYASGTVDWLAYSGVHIELTVLEDSNLPFNARIGKVVVGETDVIVVCEGAVPLDLTESRWLPRRGVHDIDLQIDEAGGCVLSGGAPLSAGALEILRAVVAHAQREFRAAVDDSAAFTDSTMSIESRVAY